MIKIRFFAPYIVVLLMMLFLNLVTFGQRKNGWLVFMSEDIVIYPSGKEMPNYENFFDNNRINGFSVNRIESVLKYYDYTRCIVKNLDSLKHKYPLYIVPVSYYVRVSSNPIFIGDSIELNMNLHGNFTLLRHCYFVDIDSLDISLIKHADAKCNLIKKPPYRYSWW